MTRPLLSKYGYEYVSCNMSFVCVVCCVIVLLSHFNHICFCPPKYNPPLSQSNVNNYKKPNSAATKSTKYRVSNKANDRDCRDVDFNDCEVVDDQCELQHNHNQSSYPSSKPPSDQSSCRSSPSPEQVIELIKLYHLKTVW